MRQSLLTNLRLVSERAKQDKHHARTHTHTHLVYASVMLNCFHNDMTATNNIEFVPSSPLVNHEQHALNLDEITRW